MGRPKTPYPAELRERAVRMISSGWAAVASISSKMGCSHEALRRWVRQAECDSGARAGTTSDERERIRELERRCTQRQMRP